MCLKNNMNMIVLEIYLNLNFFSNFFFFFFFFLMNILLRLPDPIDPMDNKVGKFQELHNHLVL